MRMSLFSISYSVVLYLVGLVACPVVGQVLPKKLVTEADYDLWGTLHQEQLSEKGKWVSYIVSYPSGHDTLFVVNSASHLKYSFTNGNTASFAKEHTFGYQTKGQMVLVDLKSGKESRVPDVTGYQFSSDGRFLVTMEAGSRLVVRKDRAVVATFEGVTEYAWNEEHTRLAYVSQQAGSVQVGYVTLAGGYASNLITSASTATYKTLKWQQSGNHLAFYDVTKDQERLYCYDLPKGQLRELQAGVTGFPEGFRIAPDQNMPLQVSRDGTKVFFGICPIVARDTNQYSSGVEVWHANDKVLYPARKLQSTVAYPQYLAVWYPDSGLVRQISTEELPWVMLTGNQEYALLANPLDYEPQYKWIADRDYYLLELSTGRLSPFLKAHSGYPDMLGNSPDGRYISYYRNQDWWLFDLVTKETKNLTAGLGAVWDNRVVDPATELVVYGIAGWSPDGKQMYLYDDTDIWAISTDGKERKRLTSGAEKQVRYRFDTSALKTISEFNYNGSQFRIYDLSQPVLLSFMDKYNGISGYSLLTPQGKIIPVASGTAAITRLKKASQSDAIVYVSERFDCSPSLLYKKGLDTTTTTIASTNTHQKHFTWGSSEMIHYTNSKGKPLQGALFYPAGYEAGKTYPMVVRIYEKLSQDVNRYENPGYRDGIGFNVTNLTLNGYAVLLADITYEGGNTGINAAESVIAGVQKVVSMGVADIGKVGLLGQSFGGYEVNFTLTQTNFFAAAVSGSGIADTICHYFTFNNDYNTIDGWRYENQQLRMAFPFYSNKEAYLRNSPILQADHISTPLLSWAGALDENVQSTQTKVLYAALRRLQKEHVMLVYPDEGHILFRPNNQKDLTLKVFDWFGYYLKGEPKADWMEAKQ